MRERILTSEQVASILQVHPFTVLKYIKQGKLKGSKLGRMYRIRESDVEAFLNKHMAQNKEPVPPKAKNTSAPNQTSAAPASTHQDHAAQNELPASSPQPAATATPTSSSTPSTEPLDQDYLLE